MKVCKLSVCKEPTLYQSVHENVSESLLQSLFLHKTIQLYFLIYSQPPVVRHFTNWWHLSPFPWTTAFTRTFATCILWCYNFNGRIKWYDISCVILYVRRQTARLNTPQQWSWRSRSSEMCRIVCLQIYATSGGRAASIFRVEDCSQTWVYTKIKQHHIVWHLRTAYVYKVP